MKQHQEKNFDFKTYILYKARKKPCWVIQYNKIFYWTSNFLSGKGLKMSSKVYKQAMALGKDELEFKNFLARM